MRKQPNRRVVALVYDGLCSFEFGCAAEVFALPRPEFGRDWYRFSTCTIDQGPLRALGGLRVQTDGGLERLARAGTIVIPGWKGIDVPVPQSLKHALRRAHARGARLVSICSGAFVLAATGLLDGKRATTHWRYTAALAARHPRIEVDAEVLYIDAGQVLTSAGSAAGLDLCLHLVRRDFGVAIANQVARRLVLPLHRDGGQAQFIEHPLPLRNADTQLARLIEQLQRNPAAEISVPELARRVAMSERTFLRRFHAATGTTPGEWLTARRIDRARELLERTRLPIERIALESGFGSAVTLRHHFRRRFGLNPTQYKERFAATR
jgi:AraC family transcriptional activator FtrA